MDEFTEHNFVLIVTSGDHLYLNEFELGQYAIIGRYGSFKNSFALMSTLHFCALLPFWKNKLND